MDDASLADSLVAPGAPSTSAGRLCSFNQKRSDSTNDGSLGSSLFGVSKMMKGVNKLNVSVHTCDMVENAGLREQGKKPRSNVDTCLTA